MIKRARLWLLAFMAGLVELACASQSSPVSPGQGGAKWTRLDTAHFHVFTDLSVEDGTRIALQLERDLDALGQAAFQSVRPMVDSTDVVVFADSEDYHHFAHRSTEGVYYQNLPLDPESPATVVTFGGINASTRTRLLHELTHDLFERNFGAAPTWLNEGWAEYYSTVRVVDGKIQIGAALPDRALTTDLDPFAAEVEGRQVIAFPISKLPSPAELMAMTGEDFYEQSNDEDPSSDQVLRQTAHYLGAWAFVHMLLDGKSRYAERFRVFQREALDSSVADAWAKAFAGVSDSELNQYFRSYLAHSKVIVFGIPYKDNVESRVQAVPLSDGDVHLLWARLHSAHLGDPHSGATTKMSQELEQAAKVAPELAEVHHWQGLLALHQRRWDVAKTSLGKAAHFAPNEPRFLWSQLRLEFLRRDGVLRPDELAELAPQFDRLAALANSPQQLMISAHYQQARGNPARAIALAEQAVKLDPFDPPLLDNYATLLESSGRVDEALQVQRRAVAFNSDSQAAQSKALRAHLETLEAQRRAQP